MNLQLSVNGTANHISNETHFFKCGTINITAVRYPQRHNCTNVNITAVPECSVTKWNITVFMDGCSQVVLRCGNRGSGGQLDLSTPVTAESLTSKSVVLVVSYSPITPNT